MNEEVVGILGGVMCMVILFMVPIVAILTNHQRKMAELLHGKKGQLPNPEVEALRNEMAEMRHLLHQQMIAIDNLSRANAPLNGHGESEAVRARLERQGGA